MPRKKLIPLEIGAYIGERIMEWGHPAPTKKEPETLRIRFVQDQKLEVGQICLYYLWDPYMRLPIRWEGRVREIEPGFIYWYDLIGSTSVKKWPPNA